MSPLSSFLFHVSAVAALARRSFAPADGALYRPPLKRNVQARSRVASGAWLLLLVLVSATTQATVVWEDYRGNANAGSNYTGPAGRPTFGNYSGDPLVNLRTISSNPANAVRTGSSANIDFLSDAHLCNAYSAPSSTACGYQAMGRVTYALIRFPAAGTYTLSVAHDDNVDVDLSSDFANTNYHAASYDVPVGSVGSYTSGETVFATVGTFTAAAANSCALVRMYWTNAGGLNFSRLRWTRPSPATTEIIPAAQMFDPGDATSANGCNGSITGNRTGVTLNKILGSPRAQAADQFSVEIGTTAAAGTVRQAGTSGSDVGLQASTGAFPAVTGTTYYLRDLMAAGSASTLAAYSATIACTRNGVSFTPAGSAPTWNVTPAAYDQIVCAITNTARPVLRLQKTLPDGRVQSSDQFVLGIAGAGAGAAAVVTTTGTTNAPTQVAMVNPATAGGSYAFTEAGAGGANPDNYLSTYSCTNSLPGGQAPSGNGASFNLVAAAGDNLTCTFSNRALLANLAISKSSNQASVPVGGSALYTLVVRNDGPAAADHAVVRDDWTTAPGLDCAAGPATCAAAGTAGTQCPTAAAVTPAALQAGLALPAFPAGGVVTLTLQCVVTASGQ